MKLEDINTRLNEFKKSFLNDCPDENTKNRFFLCLSMLENKPFSSIDKKIQDEILDLCKKHPRFAVFFNRIQPALEERYSMIEYKKRSGIAKKAIRRQAFIHRIMGKIRPLLVNEEFEYVPAMRGGGSEKLKNISEHALHFCEPENIEFVKHNGVLVPQFKPGEKVYLKPKVHNDVEIDVFEISSNSDSGIEFIDYIEATAEELQNDDIAMSFLADEASGFHTVAIFITPKSAKVNVINQEPDISKSVWWEFTYKTV